MESKYRYFDHDFKKEAVALSYQRNNISQLERELNITPRLLHQWRHNYKEVGAYCLNGQEKSNIKLGKTIIFEQNKIYTESKFRFYDSDFKEKAVQISNERSNISQLEKELNITAGLLHNWRKTFNEFGPGCFCGKGSMRINPEQ